MKALNVEAGYGGILYPVDKPLFARYGVASVRQKWSPQARRIWLDAFYALFRASSPTLRIEIAELRRKGQNMDVVEARIIGTGEKDSYVRAEALLRFAETHPKDVVAAQRAALTIDLRSGVDRFFKRPVPKDLVRRALALEARTNRNLQAWLGDPQAVSRNFRIFCIFRERSGGE